MTFLVFSVLPAPDSPLYLNWIKFKVNLTESECVSKNSRDEHRLVGSVSCHARIGVVGHQIQMWRHFVLLFATIEMNHFHCVEWQSLERIYGHAEEARIRVDVPVDVALMQVVVDGGVIQISQIGHVVTFFVFWRIHGQTLISFNCNLLYYKVVRKYMNLIHFSNCVYQKKVLTSPFEVLTVQLSPSSFTIKPVR